MLGRSRWWGGLLVWASIGSALGCSQLPLPPTDDGGVADAPPPTTLGPRPLTPIPVDAVALAADDAGIYWTSQANGLWTLPAGTRLPLPLAADSSPGPYCSFPPPPIPTARHVFWTGSNHEGVHRTARSGGDERLAAASGVGRLAADGENVYWTEGATPIGAGGVIRALAVGAPAGASPLTLVRTAGEQDVSSLAARDGALYWTPYVSVGSTVYTSTLWTATVAALAGGGAGGTLTAPRSPYGLTSTDSDLLFGFYPDLWTTSVARLPDGGAPQTIATLPMNEYVVGLASAGGWLLMSTDPNGSCNLALALNLYAAPLAGGAPKLIAEGLRAPAIAAPQGIVFVDASKRLVALPPDQIDRIVSPVP